jgi:hypothetical protein
MTPAGNVDMNEKNKQAKPGIVAATSGAKQMQISY